MSLLKGDLNYRKLLGDRAWPPTTPLTYAASWPGSFAVLRTLKSEVIAGLGEGIAQNAAAVESTWMTSGNFAVVQSNFE